jgi:hypothetical protein
MNISNIAICVYSENKKNYNIHFITKKINKKINKIKNKEK